MSEMSRKTPKPVHILVLNPNSSEHMTQGMKEAIEKLALADHIKLSYYTAPTPSPASINDNQDIQASTQVVLSDTATVQQIKDNIYDAVLIACFSVHTLVTELSPYNVPVLGIFEASLLSSLSILSDPETPQKWGIATTGKFWEEHLGEGARKFLGQSEDGETGRFAGVVSTGLTAGDFHTVPEEEVRAKLKAATKKLLDAGDVRCVVMGCGGMAGLEDIIRETAGEVYGEQRAKQMFVIDGVKAGVLQLDQVVQSRRAFSQ